MEGDQEVVESIVGDESASPELRDQPAPEGSTDNQRHFLDEIFWTPSWNFVLVNEGMMILTWEVMVGDSLVANRWGPPRRSWGLVCRILVSPDVAQEKQRKLTGWIGSIPLWTSEERPGGKTKC